MPKIKKQWKTTHINHDKAGNAVEIQYEPQHGNVRILLRLKSEKYPRRIGEVDVKNKTLTVERDKKIHFMKACQGYGFNYSVINDLNGFLFNKIIIHERDNGKNNFYQFSVDEFNEKCVKIVMQFKEQGFEIQRFVKEEFYKTKAIKFGPSSQHLF